jgi:hypothetical protein
MHCGQRVSAKGEKSLDSFSGAGYVRGDMPRGTRRRLLLLLLVDTAVTACLVVLGFLASSRLLRPTWLMPLSLLPAVLYIKLRLPSTWLEFFTAVGAMAGFCLMLFLRDFFGISYEHFEMLVIATAVFGLAYFRRRR